MTLIFAVGAAFQTLATLLFMVFYALGLYVSVGYLAVAASIGALGALLSTIGSLRGLRLASLRVLGLILGLAGLLGWGTRSFASITGDFTNPLIGLIDIGAEPAALASVAVLLVATVPPPASTHAWLFILAYGASLYLPQLVYAFPLLTYSMYSVPCAIGIAMIAVALKAPAPKAPQILAIVAGCLATFGALGFFLPFSIIGAAVIGIAASITERRP
ncbi:hypothetical protein C3B44_01820 [Corynebacterium yudongzhengii]|uniref:Uncharacterized protein n=1 Tax=Corynebacterium yudongzhengii TaxID=2080740 RepID=A0A2U1T9V6_9CORY|nr:hypothetical protein [Corynebacterium yudongzhengii]AWB81233.1 hypothetical protein C3B44_01820 [Corynebacterium yudongzhengii]PWC02772.1 hypothetical protein DF222_00550 [Corynebacterium yudongzhengii]